VPGRSDNQRRSRARRKEYLQELEAKYRLCEAVGAEASQEIQTAARKVLDENERLRRLLRQQGFNDANVDGNGPDECASSSSAAETLSVMLATPNLSASACGDSRVCKTVDTDDDDDDVDMAMDSRRQSNVSSLLQHQLLHDCGSSFDLSLLLLCVPALLHLPSLPSPDHVLSRLNRQPSTSLSHNNVSHGLFHNNNLTCRLLHKLSH
jgi:hypothetical protein